MEAPIITYVCVLYKWQVLTQSLASISEKCAEVTLQELKLFFSLYLSMSTHFSQAFSLQKL